MLVKECDEHDDGSATLKVDLSEEEVAILIEYALKKLLIEATETVDARSSEES